MEGESWPRAVEKGRRNQGWRKPEKENPRILNQQETGKPRAHSPVLAACSVTLQLYLWRGAEHQAPQYRPAEKDQAACEMSAPPTHPFPLTYPGERSWEILGKGDSCALKTTGQSETNWQEALNEWAVSALPHSVSAGPFSEGCLTLSQLREKKSLVCQRARPPLSLGSL